MDESESNVATQAIVLTIRPSSGATFTVAISTDSTVLALKEKLATADLPAASIRLVYSGRVLKDEDQLSVYCRCPFTAPLLFSFLQGFLQKKKSVDRSETKDPVRVLRAVRMHAPSSSSEDPCACVLRVHA